MQDKFVELITTAISENEFTKAARLCSEASVIVDYNKVDTIGQVLKDCYKKIEKNLSTIKVGIVSNMTLDVIENYLLYHLFTSEKLVKTQISGVAGFPFELVNPKSETRNFEPDFYFLVLDDEIIWDKVKDIHNIKDLKDQQNKFLDLLESILSDLSIQGKIITTTIPLSKRNFDKYLDFETRIILMRLWRDFNNRIIKLYSKYSNIYILDMDIILQEIAVPYEETIAYYTQMRYNHYVINALAKEFSAYIKSYLGYAKKVLALDLDNTLWEGILGDDGIQNIKMGNDYEGKAYMIFQKLLLNLKKQGVLLSICSKNDLSNVKKVFNNHPDILLKKDDFVNISANWDLKSNNLKNIAESLNLNTNSIVFIDDSFFEREEVRSNTDVVVLPFPKNIEKLSKYILDSNLFNKISLTSEDKNRTEYFKIEQLRKAGEYQAQSINYDEYLESLKMELNISINDKKNFSRLAQLEQRTNQFNLTTQRYNIQYIENLTKDYRGKVYSYELLDKYGTYGIIASILLSFNVDKDQAKFWIIESFLLSCRVFSRNVENKIIETIIEDAISNNVDYLIGKYRYTDKNKRFCDFYINNKFFLIEEKDGIQFFKYIIKNIQDSNYPIKTNYLQLKNI